MHSDELTQPKNNVQVKRELSKAQLVDGLRNGPDSTAKVLGSHITMATWHGAQLSTK